MQISQFLVFRFVPTLFSLFFTLSLLCSQSFVNLSFEEGLKGWQMGEHTDATISTAHAQTGDQSMVMAGQYSPDAPGYFYQDIDPTGTELVKYRVQASIFIPEQTGGFQADIYAYTKQGKQWLQFQEVARDTNQTGWQTYSLEIWVAPNADRFRIGCSLSGEGKLWVDNFSVEKLPLTNCELPDSLSAFMTECLDLITLHSMKRSSLSREKLAADWRRVSSCAQSIEEVANGLPIIFKLIDNHSFYASPATIRSWENTSQPEEGQAPSITYSRGEVLDGAYGYIWMPAFGSLDPRSGVTFADQMQGVIDSLNQPDVKGWILDLRDNGGGNCWPMLAGIGPLLGKGVCGYFKYQLSDVAWIYEPGKSIEGEATRTEVSRKPVILKPIPKVAVLLSGRTASSGEVIAAAFRGRPDTKSFGENTAGYSTGNGNHRLSNGGMLFIASSVYADRNGQAYPDYIPVDIAVEDNPETTEDEVIEAALVWLKQG